MIGAVQRVYQRDSSAAGRIAIAAAVLAPLGLWSAGRVVPDVGDGVNHHLSAHLAFAHPGMLLDAWSKPLFTLLAAPLASLGFAGTVLFQALVTLASAGVLWHFGQRAGWRAPWIAPLLLYVAPGTWDALLSGWTEPLFGLVLIAALWSLGGARWRLAYLLVGLLPFVRAEGWVLMVWWALLALATGRAALLLPLASGHLAYAIAGTLVVHHDPLWMFRENPYWLADRTYGHGTWAHFFTGYPTIAGLPAALATATAGVAIALRRAHGLRHRHRTALGEDCPEALWSDFVLGSLVAYFAAHVIFWRFGLFKSFGLLRVLIAVLPLGSLLVAGELDALCRRFPPRLARLAQWGACLVLVVWALGDQPSSVRLGARLQPSVQQRAVDAAVARLRTVYATPADTPLVYSSNPYVAFALDLDVFDRARSRALAELNDMEPVPGAVIVWDSWFSVAEHGLTDEELRRLALDDRQGFVVRSPDGGSYEVVTGIVPLTASPVPPR